MNNLDKSRYVQIGLKIAYYRKLNNWTQEKLAEKIGISPGYLSQVETPSFIQPISLATLFALADAFQIPPYKLLQFDDIEEIP
ncbi:MAG: helix-turn-helix transcriptional regulator [Ruminococcaceae bacterium]|nr:helix-turn-helix transcriptional regulator [Oscillospiraceae bacterium]